MNSLFNKTPKSTRYTIEKSYNKRIKSLYTAISKINKQETLLTDDSEKIYIKAERDYQKTINTITLTHEKNIAETKQKQQLELSEKNQIIQTLKKQNKEQVEALKLDAKKSFIFLEDEIEQIKQEKELKNKEIEKKYAQHNRTYQRRLSLFKKNLVENQEATRERLHDAVSTMITLKDNINKKTDESIKEFNDSLDQFKTTLTTRKHQSIEEAKTALNQTKRNMNDLRKTLNQYTKTLSDLNIAKKSALDAPFLAIFKLVNDLSSSYKDSDDYKTRVNTDYDTEKTRINNIIKKQENMDPKTKRSYLTRLKLIEKRKNTLLTQHTALNKLITEELQTIASLLEDSNTIIEASFESLETTIKDHQLFIKQRFSDIEAYFETMFKTTKTTVEAHDIASDYDSIKSTIDHALKALIEFQNIRLTTHINYTKNITPIIESIDELTTELDTVEPRKELEVSKQKMLNEQEEGSVRFDMKIAKLNHDLTLQKIENEARQEKQKTLNEMNIIKAIEQRDNTKTTHKFDLTVLEQTFETDKANELHNLRKTHVHDDLTTAKEKEKYEIKTLECEKDIKIATLEREFETENYDLTEESKEKTLHFTYDIKNAKQNLSIALDKKQHKIDQENNTFNAQKEKLINDFKQQESTIEESLEEASTTYQNQKAFIDKALNKETETAKQNIREINDLLKEKLIKISDAVSPVQATLTSYKNNMNNQSAPLKEHLQLIASPFSNNVVTWLIQSFSTIEESFNFIYALKEKQLKANTKSPKKLQSSLKKLEAEHEKQRLNTQKHHTTLKQEILNNIKSTEKSIKTKENLNITLIKSIVKPLYDYLATVVKSTLETFIADLKTAYKALQEHDAYIIQKAKENHEKAQQQTKQNYETQQKPLLESLDNLKDRQAESLEKLETEFKDTLDKRLDALDKQITSIRTTIQSLENNKHAIDSEYEKLLTDLKANFNQAKQDVITSFEQSKQSVQDGYAKYRAKLNDKLKDLKEMHTYELDMLEREINHHEVIKEDEITHHATIAEKEAQTYQHHLKTIEKNKLKQQDDAHKSLKALTEDFETKLLNTTSLLDKRIEDATRKINQDATSKQTQLNQLNTQLKTMQDNLEETIEKENTKLQKSLNRIFKPSETKDKDDILTSYNTTNESFVDTVIKETTQAILKSR